MAQNLHRLLPHEFLVIDEEYYCEPTVKDKNQLKNLRSLGIQHFSILVNSNPIGFYWQNASLFRIVFRSAEKLCPRFQIEFKISQYEWEQIIKERPWPFRENKSLQCSKVKQRQKKYLGRIT